jgi:Uma2 family endonuclease
MIASPSVKVPASLRLSDEQFLQFVKANADLRMERTAQGELIVMSPTGSEGGSRNFEVNVDLGTWNRQVRLGIAFDSSTGFRLPNGAIRSPDASWIANARWKALTPEQRKGFAPICPDFVMELASETDDIKELRAKMQEYLDNGCRLGWLIDPRSQQVEIYRAGKAVEVLNSPQSLSGEEILPGFVLSLGQLFECLG